MLPCPSYHMIFYRKINNKSTGVTGVFLIGTFFYALRIEKRLTLIIFTSNKQLIYIFNKKYLTTKDD
jgi:hypothetical protein